MKHVRLRVFLLAALSVCAFAAANAVEPQRGAAETVKSARSTTATLPAVARLAGFASYVDRARADLGNVGVAVAIVHNDQVIFAQGFGVKEYGKPAPVGPDTLFQIGSTSKAFACAALGILVDEGKLRWDDPVIDYLPSFQLQDPWLTRHLTLRDTVTHRSGVVGAPYLVMSVMNDDEVVQQLRYASPEGSFRDSYLYSNQMYAVAGNVAAAASAMSWREWVRRRLLQPLQMKRSGTSPYEFWDAQYVAPTFQGFAQAPRFSHTDARDADVAMPHVMDEQGVPHVIAWQSYDNAAAAGSIVSSVNDMANWLIMNLNEGRFAGQQVLSAETIKELHTVQNLRYDEKFPFEGSSEGYAMGWHEFRYHERKLLAHGGGIIGFPAFVAMMPDQRLGVVVLSNSEQSAMGDVQAFRKAIALRAFDQLLKVPLREWSQEFQARGKQAAVDASREDEKLRKSRLQNAPPSLRLAQYAGDYEDLKQHSGPITVRLDGEQLSLSFAGEGAFSAVLDHWHGEVFRLRKKGPGRQAVQFATFVVDQEGTAASMLALGAQFDRLHAAVAP